MPERYRPTPVEQPEPKKSRMELRIEREVKRAFVDEAQSQLDERRKRILKEQLKAQRRAVQVSIFRAKQLGRPSVYDPAMVGLLADYRMLGIPTEKIADLLGTSVVLFYQWLQRYPDFLYAFEQGGHVADAKVTRALFARATGYSHPDVHVSNFQGEVTLTDITKHYPPDPGAATFWLTNRRRDEWKTRQSTELSNPDGTALTPPTIVIQGVSKKDAE